MKNLFKFTLMLLTTVFVSTARLDAATVISNTQITIINNNAKHPVMLEQRSTDGFSHSAWKRHSKSHKHVGPKQSRTYTVNANSGMEYRLSAHKKHSSSANGCDLTNYSSWTYGADGKFTLGSSFQGNELDH